MICSKCNSEIKDGSKFCTNCGEPLPKTKKCIQCGAFIKEDALFCTNCGTKQPIKEEKPKIEKVQPKNEVKTDNPTLKKEKKTIVTETSKTEEKNIVSQPKQQPTNKQTASFSRKEPKQSVPKRDSKRKGTISWSAVLFVIGILLFGVYKVYFKGKDKIAEISQRQNYSSEAVGASSNGNVVQNNKEDDFEPITFEEFYNDYVFGNKDFSKIANKVCTPRLLQYLKDAYEYECEDGECYAMWLFRSGNQDGTSDECRVVNVKDEGDGWVGVFFIDMGIKDTIYIRFVQYNGKKLMDEIWKSK